MEPILCVHCYSLFFPSPRNKNQSCCTKPSCRRAKKAAWKRAKLKKDPQFKEDQRLSNKKWAANHPGYWKRYRQQNPEKAQRNRILQVIRNRKRRAGSLHQKALIAKVDASKSPKFNMVGRFWLVPLIAKVDALKVNIVEIPEPYQ